MNKQITFVAISDTHGKHRNVKNLPNGDVLLFAGDCMSDGYSQWELEDFLKWLDSLPYEYKVMIAGNHDRLIENMPEYFKTMLTKYPSIIYLENSGVEIAGINIWGAPYSRKFGRWAFNASEEDLTNYADMIAKDTNILLSHAPAYGIRDILEDGMHVGEHSLFHKIYHDLELDYHVFGHIHNAYGTVKHSTLKGNPPEKVKKDYYAMNVALLDEKYRLVNNPIAFGYDIKDESWEELKEVKTKKP